MFDRDEQEISQIIENGLEAILSGEATLESVVAQHPEQVEVIRPELEGALWLVSQRQEVEARPGFVTASRKRVVDRIKAEARSQGAKRSLFGFAWPKQMHAFQWVAGAMVILMLMLGTGGIVTISQSSLPGDGLYAVKRISETVSYTVTLNEVQRVQLSAQFAERRIAEVETLVAKGSFTAAGSALSAYKQQIKLTVALLDKVSNTVAREKLGVAIAFKNDLVQNADRLNDMLASAPPVLQGQLADAKEMTDLGAASTEALILAIPTVDLTGTPTPTGTLTPVGTPTPDYTATAEFSETPVPADLYPLADDTQTLTPPAPGLAGTPDPANGTLTPGDPTNTLTPEEQATKIAKTKKPVPTQKPPPVTSNKSDTKEKDNNKGGKGK